MSTTSDIKNVGSHVSSMVGDFNFHSAGKMLLEGVVLGAIGYAVWHTGIALPFIEAATPWIVSGLEFAQVDHAFDFMASLIPDFVYETPSIPVDSVVGAGDALTGGDDLLGLDDFLNE